MNLLNIYNSFQKAKKEQLEEISKEIDLAMYKELKSTMKNNPLIAKKQIDNIKDVEVKSMMYEMLTDVLCNRLVSIEVTEVIITCRNIRR